MALKKAAKADTNARVSRSVGKKDRSYMKKLLFSLFMGIITSLLLLVVLSVLIIRSDVNKEYVPFAAISASSVGAFVAAFTAARKSRKRGLIVGLLLGAAVFALLFVLSVSLNSGAVGLNTAYSFLGAIAGGGIGGVCGVNLRSR